MCACVCVCDIECIWNDFPKFCEHVGHAVSATHINGNDDHDEWQAALLLHPLPPAGCWILFDALDCLWFHQVVWGITQNWIQDKHGQELPCEFVSFMLEPMFRPCSNVEEMPRGSILGPLSKSQRRKAVQSTLQLFCAQRMTTKIALIPSEPYYCNWDNNG